MLSRQNNSGDEGPGQCKAFCSAHSMALGFSERVVSDHVPVIAHKSFSLLVLFCICPCCHIAWLCMLEYDAREKSTEEELRCNATAIHAGTRKFENHDEHV